MVSNATVPVDATNDAWRRALVRARARGYELEFIKDVVVRGYSYRVWRVASASDPGTFHYVSLARMDTGWVVTCDCKAGEHDKPCVHAALALLQENILSAPPAMLVPAA